MHFSVHLYIAMHFDKNADLVLNKVEFREQYYALLPNQCEEIYF